MSPVKQKSVRILLFLFYFLSLLETSFSSSPQRSILSLSMIVPHIQQNPGGNKGFCMQCTDRRIKTGFCLDTNRNRNQEKRNQRKKSKNRKRNSEGDIRCGGSAWKNSPLWPVVPLDSGRAEWQCADIKRPPIHSAGTLINCDTVDQPRISSPLRAIRFAAGGEIIFPGGTHLTIFLHNTLPYFSIVPPYSIRASFSWGDTLQLTAHSWETVDASGMIDGDDNW